MVRVSWLKSPHLIRCVKQLHKEKICLCTTTVEGEDCFVFNNYWERRCLFEFEFRKQQLPMKGVTWLPARGIVCCCYYQLFVVTVSTASKTASEKKNLLAVTANTARKRMYRYRRDLTSNTSIGIIEKKFIAHPCLPCPNNHCYFGTSTNHSLGYSRDKQSFRVIQGWRK